MDDIKERIKVIRKDKKLNQKEFGSRLTLSQNHISCLEKGTRKITEKFINDLCKEYNVNKEWLKTGKGEKYTNTSLALIEELKCNDKALENFFKNFLKLDVQSQAIIIGFTNSRINQEQKDIK